MTIKDNIITFEPSDIKKLSPAYQRALAIYFGERAKPEVELSKVIAGVFSSAVAAAKAHQMARLEALARGHALESDPDKVAQVNTLLDQARTVIGVPVDGVPVTVYPPPKQGIMAKILSRIQKFR